MGRKGVLSPPEQGDSCSLGLVRCCSIAGVEVRSSQACSEAILAVPSPYTRRGVLWKSPFPPAWEWRLPQGCQREKPMAALPGMNPLHPAARPWGGVMVGN